jgi:transcriptional regulator GlxA family with amidase domain
LCLLPASASDTAAAHVADSDGVLRKPLDVNAVRWHVHQLLGAAALPDDPLRWSRHVNNVFAYVSQHYHEPLRVDAVARAIGISLGHLVHLFPAETCTSVRTCVMRIRCEVAKHALTWTDDKLDVVAERAGFCDASHLSRVFRLYARKRPGAFRRQVRDRQGREVATA